MHGGRVTAHFGVMGPLDQKSPLSGSCCNSELRLLFPRCRKSGCIAN